MKPISLDTQKKIVFIPYANIAVPFIWVFNCVAQTRTVTVFLRTFFIVFSTVIPLFIFQVYLSGYPKMDFIRVLITGYLIPVVIGVRLIRYQDSLGVK